MFLEVEMCLLTENKPNDKSNEDIEKIFVVPFLVLMLLFSQF